MAIISRDPLDVADADDSVSSKPISQSVSVQYTVCVFRNTIYHDCNSGASFPVKGMWWWGEVLGWSEYLLLGFRKCRVGPC